MAGPGFAVIDCETTGLFPKLDRVVELAIVHVDSAGRIEGRWETLLNPARDLGPHRIHGEGASDVTQAPSFADVAPRLIELLTGRVLVAHNASFDTRFLMSEFQRAGYEAMPTLVTLCTMQLARDYLPGAGRSLADCCAAYDIDVVGAHRASADALATARLLGAYLSESGGIGRQVARWDLHIAEGSSVDWPPAAHAMPIHWAPRPVTAVSEPTVSSFLQRVTVKLPEFAGPDAYLDYLALLDQCMLDRKFSAHEAEALVALAETLGIDRSSCEQLHIDFFEALAQTAWADAALTAEEIADLLAVAELLDVSSATISRALQAPRAAAGRSPDASPASFSLEPGDRIVLTGELVRSRAEWERELWGRGFTPGPAVTKKVRLVVAADPDSLSGKARKARDYGIAVVSESGLARLLSEMPTGLA